MCANLILDEGYELVTHTFSSEITRSKFLINLGKALHVAVPGAHKIEVKDLVSPPEAIIESVFWFRLANDSLLPLQVFFPAGSTDKPEYAASYAKYVISRQLERLAGIPE